MKKRFKSRKKLNNLKKIIYLIFILIGFFLSYLYFYYKVRNMISSEDYLNYLLKVGFNNQIDRSYIKSSLLNNITLTNTSKTENNNTNEENTKESKNEEADLPLEEKKPAPKNKKKRSKKQHAKKEESDDSTVDQIVDEILDKSI